VVSEDVVSVDTTALSFLHHQQWLSGRRDSPSLLRIYFIVAGCTYLPLVVAALLSPIPVASPSENLRLPFLYDWNVAWMFLVSLPCLVALTITDQQALSSSLRRVQADGILMVSKPDAGLLTSRWAHRYRIANIIGQGVGVVVGMLIAYFNYVSYSARSTGYWIARDGRLVIAGYVFILCIFVFYALIPPYIVRSFCTSLFLRDLVRHASLRMLPFHPDRSGGLRPVGRLGLRNQYGLTVFGINLVSLVAISVLYLQVPPALIGLIVAAGLAYVALGPAVFMGPLLPFRAGMLRSKTELMGEVAQRLRVELHRLRAQLPSGPITREDEELIDRLRKVGQVIDELPVWPFDASTLRRFLTAYVIPVAGAVAYPVITTIIEAIAARLPR
jgi:hypothetical protein